MAHVSTDYRQAIVQRSVEAILDAAETLLERRAPTTISAVAAEAGVSRMTVYTRFETREQLLEAVLERAIQHAARVLEAADPEEGPAEAALERLVSASWRELARNESIARAASEELSDEALNRAHAAAREAIRQLVDRGKREGDFRATAPSEWLVTSFQSLMHGAAEEVRAGRLSEDEADQLLSAAIRDVFVGAADRGVSPGRG